MCDISGTFPAYPVVHDMPGVGDVLSVRLIYVGSTAVLTLGGVFKTTYQAFYCESGRRLFLFLALLAAACYNYVYIY